MGRIVITGGCGFVGRKLAHHIAKEHADLGQVVLFDRHKPSEVLPPGMEFVSGDIRSYMDVQMALREATAVVHSASYGMSGEEGMHPDLVEEVNVQGTVNVINACKQHNVSQLVYVSTYNAVWDNVTPIHGGTEDKARYVTSAVCSDPYSLTKAQAEQAVLAANGSPLQGGGELHTCALRPAGIWGPGETRHMPRIVRLMRQGWIKHIFGDPRSKVDFTHVDNLVSACTLALVDLSGKKKSAGKAYFINDDNPINNFAFFGKLLTGLGYRWPRTRVPYGLVWLAALLMELWAHILFTVSNRVLFVPILDRKEVAKCAVTHYYKCDAAKRDLGYKPQQHSVEEAVEWYKLRNYGPVEEAPEVRAVRIVRRIRVAMALGMVALVWMSWHNTAEKQRKLQLDAALLAQGGTGVSAGAGGGLLGAGDHGGEL